MSKTKEPRFILRELRRARGGRSWWQVVWTGAGAKRAAKREAASQEAGARTSMIDRRVHAARGTA